jgi:hypothetical protein
MGADEVAVCYAEPEGLYVCMASFAVDAGTAAVSNYAHTAIVKSIVLSVWDNRYVFTANVDPVAISVGGQNDVNTNVIKTGVYYALEIEYVHIIVLEYNVLYAVVVLLAPTVNERVFVFSVRGHICAYTNDRRINVSSVIPALPVKTVNTSTSLAPAGSPIVSVVTVSSIQTTPSLVVSVSKNIM